MTLTSEIVYLNRMKITEQLKRPIRDELELFEKRFSDAMSSKVALLNRITHYIVNRKGKQMRPMFIFQLQRCWEIPINEPFEQHP